MNWKVTLPCTRAEGEALGDDWELLSSLRPSPSLVVEEVEAFNDAKWQIVAYFDDKPRSLVITALHKRLPSAVKAKPVLEQIPDEDWLTLSQQNLAPVQAGRFFVHTPDYQGSVPKGSTRFVIPASQAFGTGGHETTSGCLAMLDRLARTGKRFCNVADIGTGTGLLAFAAMKLWPMARYIASDIDPVSIDVSRYNAVENSIATGRNYGQITLVAAPGTDHATIRGRAPFDLLIANILAGPLIELAPAFAAVTATGGSLILAGLLDIQADTIVATYYRHGFRLVERRDAGDWPCLHLIRRSRYGYRRPLRSTGRTSQPQGDTGEW